MKKELSPILDPESVPLRIDFALGQRLTDEDIALSIKALVAGLESWPDHIPLPPEVIVVSRNGAQIVLLVGSVDQAESHRLFHSVEQAFPSAVSAHLGNNALEDEVTITQLPDTCRMLGFEWWILISNATLFVRLFPLSSSPCDAFTSKNLD